MCLYTKKLFERFAVNHTFLYEDPLNWENNKGNNKAPLILKRIPVINDVAETWVKLTEDRNKKITEVESQKQYRLQVII